MRHLAHVAFIGLGATLGQQRRFLGQRVQEFGQPAGLVIALVRLEVAQHPVQHEVLVAGMADADADATIVVADMGVDVAQAVVAAGAAALLHAHAAGRKVELVVEHHHAVQRHLEIAHRLTNRAARFVHEGLGLEHDGALAAQVTLGHQAVEALAPRREDTAADDLVHRHESHVVPVPRIAGPGIAEPDQQEHRPVLCRRRSAYFFAGAGALPPAAGAAAPAAGAAPPAAGAAPGAAGAAPGAAAPSATAGAAAAAAASAALAAASSRTTVGAAIEATVGFLSRVTTRTPSGTLRADRCTEWPISRPVRSTSKNSGMAAGLVRTVISCSTTFSTPPRLMPGAW